MIISGKPKRPETGNTAIESQVQREWNGSTALQEEFTSYENYAAYRQAELQGRVRTHGSNPRISRP